MRTLPRPLASSVRWTITLRLVALVAVGGCSGRPGRVATPSVDPEAAAEQAMEMYDTNSDGQLSADELKASPALLAALATYDVDRSASLAASEISAGINAWTQRGIGAMALAFTVRLDGRPLEGAEIRLIPAPFLGDAIKPAHGTADGTGSGSFAMSEADKPSNAPKNLPVVQPGLYAVEITHPGKSIPAKFNAQTTLGLESSVAGQNPMGVVWSLKSR